MSTSLFRGLSAFPITPADREGRVDIAALQRLVAHLSAAGVDSIGLLGSTGTYAYLTREARRTAIEAAVACVRGRTPLLVGIGALRTDAVLALARDAETAGADALLLAPVSYTPLTPTEVYEHFRSVAAATSLPICIYNNPTTTHFTFGRDLLQRLGDIETICAVKMPLPANGDIREELLDLRGRTRLAIGYSGDWGAADALLAGADAWYSVLAGLMPAPALAMVRAAQTGDVDTVRWIDGLLQPLWDTFKLFGGLRVMHAAQTLVGFEAAELPRPLLPLEGHDSARVEAALTSLRDAALWDGPDRG